MKYITLGDTKVPNIPFLWYREEQLVCPIIDISQPGPHPSPPYIITQEHVLPDSNVYICLHSLLFTTLNPDLDIIPPNYAVNVNFTTNVLSDNINIINNSGPVNIHDSAFSPCGVHCFKVVDKAKVTEIFCEVSGGGIVGKYIFVLNPVSF